MLKKTFYLPRNIFEEIFNEIQHHVENLMVIRVEVIAPETVGKVKISLNKRFHYLQASRNNFV
jgi:hypothetical protein